MIIKRTLLLWCSFGFITTIASAQCDISDADWEDNTVPYTYSETDGSCVPGTGVNNIAGIYTIQAGANVDFSTTGVITLTGTITIEDGATMSTNGTLRVSGGTLNVNGDLQVGDGGAGDNLGIPNGGVVNVNSTGSVGISGDVNDGAPGGGGVGTINLNGTMNVTGEFNNNAGGNLNGNGYLTYGSFDDNGGSFSGAFAQAECTDGSGDCGDVTLPVELLSFRAADVNGRAVLKWETASEINNMGFHVERSYDGDTFEEVAFVDGHGTTTEPQSYSFREPTMGSGVYYRLRQEDFDGTTEYLGVRFVHTKMRINAEIYPNPIRGNMFIAGDRSKDHTVTLTDISGESVLKISNAKLTKIQRILNDNLSGLSKGVFLLTIVNDTGREVKRIVVD